MNLIQLSIFMLLIITTCLGGKYYESSDFGVFLTEDHNVYQYEGYVYIPYTLTLPFDKILSMLSQYKQKSFDNIDEMFLDNCPIVDTIENYIKNVQEYLNNVIPDPNVITPKYTGITEVLDKKNYNSSIIEQETRTRSKLTIKNSSNLKRRLSLVKIDSTDPSNVNFVRHKRLEPVTITLMVVGILAGAGFVWNRIDISKLNSEAELINQQMDAFESKLDESIDAINKLSTNLNWVHNAIIDINHDLQNITGTLNCHIMLTDIIVNELSSWLYTTVQSFIRALNSGLMGNINLDLLSGINLNKLVESHINLRDTVYVQQPHLVYKIGKFELLKIYKSDRPMITGMFILPNIKPLSLGNIYKAYTCPFPVGGGSFLRLNLPENVLLEHSESEWMEISINECAASTTMTVCPLHAISGRYEKCIESIHKKILSDTLLNCPRSPVHPQYRGDIITTSLGLIACPTNSTVNIMWYTDYNVEKTKQLDLKYKSTMLTSNKVNKVLYNNNIYIVKDSLFLNVTPITIDNSHWNISSKSIHDFESSWENIPHIDYVPHIRRLISYHDIIMYVIIVILILLIIGLFCYWKKRDIEYMAGFTLFSRYYKKTDQKVNFKQVESNDTDTEL